MGSGRWDTSTYGERARAKAAAGTPTFSHDSSVRSSGRWEVHETLDAKKPNTVGKIVREAFDSDEHPESTPIAVIFDVTGSMHDIPRVLQQKLPQLHGLLQRKGYVEHPQILFGAVGDATCDRVPLQIGQFESDNRMDEALENFVLEGGGGGGNHESYQLAAYFIARHADLDSLNRRGKKGYLFLIGDERLYDTITRAQVAELIGDGLQENISTRDIFEELREKFEVFFLFAAQGSYQPEDVLFGEAKPGVCYWRDLLGQNAIILEDADAVCETIALTLGVMEGRVSLKEGTEDLVAIGADRRLVETASKALEPVGAGAGAVAHSSGSLDLSGKE